MTPDTNAVAAGDRMPHFTVRGTDGAEQRYRDAWQLRNAIVVVLDDTPGSAEWADGLQRRQREFAELETILLITRDEIPRLPRPGIVIADRWGEIRMVTDDRDIRDWPDADALLEWVRYIQHQCPECEGEAR